MSSSLVNLVRLAQQEAPGAMDRLCDQWLPVVLGWTTRLGGRRIDPEDAAHDVFLILFRRIGELQKPEAFESWLFGITRRVIAARRRRAWIRRWLPGAVPDVPETRPDPARSAEQSDVATQVWAALEELPDHHREVLVLCDLEERADSEVAEMLQVPKGTIKSRLRRARLALREKLPELLQVEFPDQDPLLARGST
ncbi:MAG: sigma-70 family RNA polymerase sigma factor [Myxococcota bacterium]